MSKETTTNSRPVTAYTPGNGTTPKSRKRQLLLAGGILLVVGIFAMQSMIPALGDFDKDSQTNSLDAEDYVGQAIDDMAYLPAVDADAAIAQANAALDAANQEALSTLAVEVAAIQSDVEDLLALPAGIPHAPSGYLSGDAVAQYVGPVMPQEPFTVPALPGELSAGDFQELAWEYVPNPVSAEEDGFFPKSGVEQLDAAAQQVADGRGQLEDLLGAGELDAIWGLLESQGLPSGRGADQTVPAEGLGDVDGAVDPDDEGARLAGTHGTMVLQTAEEKLAAFEEDVKEIEQIHADLVALVDFVTTTSPALENETVLRLADELQKRIGALDAQLDDAINMAETEYADYETLVEDARANLTLGLGETVEERVAFVQQVGAEQVAFLMSELDRAASEAELAIVETTSATEDAIATLEQLEADTGKDMSRMTALLQTSSDAVVSEIRLDALQTQNKLHQAAGDLQKQTELYAEAIFMLTADTKSLVDKQFDAALARGELATDFLLARADYIHATSIDSVKSLHDATREKFLEASQAHTAGILATAWEINQNASETLDGADQLVLQIQDDVLELVSNDTTYIWDVVDDLRKVPTPDRESAAGELEALVTLLEGNLGQMTDFGGEFDDLLALVTKVQGDVFWAEGELRDRGANGF